MSKKSKRVLVFGEDDSDREALKQLMMATRADLPRVEKRRKPLILVKGLAQAKARKNAADVAKVVSVDQKQYDVRLVVAHQDCDAVEPAHVGLSQRIEDGLAARDIPALAATPAWEMEAWWYLWPDAVAAVHSGWRKLVRHGQCVGLLQNAKEQLRKDLRPSRRGKPPRDYRESDAPAIAAKVREMGLIDQPVAMSDSFIHFRDRLRHLSL